MVNNYHNISLGCSVCTSADVCTTCNSPGYNLSGGVCKPCNTANCLTCSSSIVINILYIILI